MTGVPRVAFFADSFHQLDGLSATIRELENFARRRGWPLFSVRTGQRTRFTSEGTVSVLELQRGPATIQLDEELRFDPFFWRYAWRVEQTLRRWKPDVIHVTGPGDAGIMGAYCAYLHRIPLVASWHTNLHEVAARRLAQLLAFVPPRYLEFAVDRTQRHTLDGIALFYRIARVLLAPDPDLMEQLRLRTGKPVLQMSPGVDTDLFHPSRRFRQDGAFRIGFAGRLDRDSGVRLLAQLERRLPDGNCLFLIVGDGPEAAWLKRNLRRAEFPGALEGVALACAFASMDLFTLPGYGNEFGNGVREALASGVPAVVYASGSARHTVRSGVNGYVARNEEDFLWGAQEIVSSPLLHQHMREEARRSALATSWDVVFGKVYEAYSAALAPRGAMKAAS